MIRLAAILAIMATTAGAQSNCAPRQALIDNLLERFGETRQSEALDAAGRLIEVTANLDTGSWTLMVTQPGQVTCLVASGQNYVPIVEIKGERS